MKTTRITDVANSIIDQSLSKKHFDQNRKFKDVSIIKLSLDIDSERLLTDVEKIDSTINDEFENSISKKYTNVRNDSYKNAVLSDATLEAIDAQQVIDDIRGISWKDRDLSMKRRVSSLIYLNDDYDPLYDERNYKVNPAIINGTYLQDIMNNLKSVVNRVRISTLLPNSGLRPHKDIPTMLGGRIHIPLVTSDYSLFFSCSDNKVRSIKMDLNSAYFINTGIEHWVHNFGTQPRTHLVMCTSAFFDDGEVLW